MIPEFAWPWLLLLIPVWGLILLIPVAKTERIAVYFPYLEMYTDTERAFTFSRLAWYCGQVLVWALLCIALARPQLTGAPLPDTRLARNLVLALDISESMATQDMVTGQRITDRLTAAQSVLDDFIKRRSGDQIGLVLFGSKAYIQAPLTFDTNTVQALLNETEIGIAGRKTAIGDALLLSIKLIDNTKDATPANSSIILLSDGSNTSGSVSPQVASELAQEKNIRIYTIGFGNSVYRQEVDERTLNAIAKSTGGQFFRAQNTDQLAVIYDRLDQLNRTETRQQSYRPVDEVYYIPLSAALILCILMLLIYSMQPLVSRMRQ